MAFGLRAAPMAMMANFDDVVRYSIETKLKDITDEAANYWLGSRSGV